MESGCARHEVLLEHCVTALGRHFVPRGEDIFGINVTGSASIHKFLDRGADRGMVPEVWAKTKASS